MSDAAPASLLESLESRQDEVLRALDELNQRIERAIAAFLPERRLVAPVQMPGLVDGAQQAQSDRQAEQAA